MRSSRIVTGAAAVLAACGVLGMAPAGQAGSASVPAWTKQAPAAHPTARYSTATAYDAATGTVVLFGGATSGGLRADTWTWDGTTWTKQAPAASPSARCCTAMAYDTATDTAVLFGGNGRDGSTDDTWTWG
jgi:hypothetical protein